MLNGRFKGGYITRRYGDPQQNIHAIQLEMSQCCYMNECWPFDYLEDKAGDIQSLLKRMLVSVLAFTKSR